MSLREEQTAGSSAYGKKGHPITKVYDGELFLGTLRNDGFRSWDGEFVNNWVAFAGGAMVPMPGGFPISRETAKRELVRYASRDESATPDSDGIFCGTARHGGWWARKDDVVTFGETRGAATAELRKRLSDNG